VEAAARVYVSDEMFLIEERDGKRVRDVNNKQVTK
jgi:hypothetical protein